ncbi:MAG TPA: winged helix-turn-helix transcriptional regulator [Candidatus Norongarragalinales archaeon]|nr:winged helix-turn-helix transcriptional regulator [Candidatus Norongarragalinales archaeon]
MLERDFVYLELLTAPKGTRLTQLGLAKTLGISLSTVHHALQPLKRMGAVTIKARGLEVADWERVLVHFANVRNLYEDIVYQTRAETTPVELEKSMPAGIAFTAYSGYRLRYREAPADYSEVLVYADEATVRETQRRFPEKKGPANLIVLAAGKKLPQKCAENVVPDALLFADLWNLKEWYARDYLEALRKRLTG